jgi:hypothetical protein
MMTNRKAAPAKHRRAGKAIDGQVGKDAQDAEKAKAAFLETFGHHFAPPTEAQRFATKYCLAENQPFTATVCGWWFLCCPEIVGKKQWQDLAAAAGVFKRLALLDHLPLAAKLGNTYCVAGGWGCERPHYEKLLSALNGCVGLPDDSDAERLRREWLDTLKTRLGHASKFNPRRKGSGGSANHALKAASEEAAAAGWPPDALAAALLLNGADRPSWEALRRKVAQRWREWGFM